MSLQRKLCVSQSVVLQFRAPGTSLPGCCMLDDLSSCLSLPLCQGVLAFIIGASIRSSRSHIILVIVYPQGGGVGQGAEGSGGRGLRLPHHRHARTSSS